MIGALARNAVSFRRSTDFEDAGEDMATSGHSFESSVGASNRENLTVRRGSRLAILPEGHTNDKGEDTPNQIAAQVAMGAKDDFCRRLPENLLKEYNSRDCIAPFKTSEIVIGTKLGSGEFSHVYEIRFFEKDNAIEPDLDDDQRETRNYMKRREKYRDTRKVCYAVKHLRPDLITRYDTLEYAQAASDLVMEAEFLSSLQHPNIIKLRGISFDGPEGFQHGPKGFFLIIDRLDDTLDRRLRKWERARKGILSNIKLKDPDGENRITEKQWDVCLRIAAALDYLHEKNIIFRDLKPANVGFDVRGDVKLFDFGLATIMSPDGDPYVDTFEMSGAGSPRYMAPEVLKEIPDSYNLKADVYTFGIVAWHILSLQLPYSFVKSREHLVDYVVKQGWRPEVPESWPEAIKEKLHASFDVQMANRPTMSSFYETLRFQILERAGTERSDKFAHGAIQRRRSRYSVRNLQDGVDDRGGIRKNLYKRLDKARDKFRGRRLTVA
mmetsp:Transcript_24203/g.37953  ORF Transcript_24203/g.37953 Transcript_24203/m.37953 type:complete len:496 (-) Transcript_24203:135-1622(-)|eukprot:CAMPEP_0201735472 /NCGR_PEP_ID=MMETSP0593-20130828/37155_1 /ASSEMBLY_ACC=CAM_ASM_000672 /TAXON_ID=267983 /ORGANISM="Skeletonema japonicum, Strain CCMP2506" /LENGTH=495 /DNA_ID=CAMNT_0048229027 /DNA_START=145 /DNA_END=1632 /DNA_ORIENTATION=-